MSKKQPKSNRDISGRNDSPSKKDEVDDKNKKEKERITEYRKELSISSIHSGPLPSPEVMVGYKEVISDGPERILKMTEKQSEHRMKMESRGQLFALIIAILGILSAVITGIWGSPWVGVAIGGGTLAILVVAFLKGSFGRG